MSNISTNNNLLNWHHPTKVYFGESVLLQLSKLIEENFPSVKNALLVTGKYHLKSNEYFNNSINNLSSLNIEIYDKIDPYPSPETVTLLSDTMKKNKSHLVLAAGGGSVMDASKAASLLSQNDGDWMVYSSGAKKVAKKGLPLIAIPTTSGSSSEVTKFATIWNWDKNSSAGLNNELMFPDIAVIDPKLTQTMSANLAANSGWDALTSSFESYWSTESNSITDLYALKSIEIFFNDLENSVNNANPHSRSECALGATISGIGYSNSRPNLCHAIGTPLTLNWKTTHGQAVCISLPYFLPFIFDKLPTSKQNLLLSTCKVTNIDSLILKLKEMITNCKLNIYLDDCDISSNNLDKILNGIPMERFLTVPTKFETNTIKSIMSKMFNIK